MGLTWLGSRFYGGCLLDITGVGFVQRSFLPVYVCRALICSLPHISDILDHVKQLALHGLFFGIAWPHDKAHADNADRKR